jgi:hypothetical protein
MNGKIFQVTLPLSGKKEINDLENQKLVISFATHLKNRIKII